MTKSLIGVQTIALGGSDLSMLEYHSSVPWRRSNLRNSIWKAFQTQYLLRVTELCVAYLVDVQVLGALMIRWHLSAIFDKALSSESVSRALQNDTFRVPMLHAEMETSPFLSFPLAHSGLYMYHHQPPPPPLQSFFTILDLPGALLGSTWAVQLQWLKVTSIRESVNSLYGGGADTHYIQYLSKSHETQPQTGFKLKEVSSQRTSWVILQPAKLKSFPKSIVDES